MLGKIDGNTTLVELFELLKETQAATINLTLSDHNDNPLGLILVCNETETISEIKSRIEDLLN